MKEPVIGYAIDNDRNRRPVIINLEVGDKVLCTKTQRGPCDGGSPFMVFVGETLSAGREYTVSSIHQWGMTKVPCVVDNDACTVWVEPHLFQII